ncbi:MAG: WD40 repeat domain-containing protein, partial [Rivularia sp. (in: cyanobacteria)]
RLANSDVKVRIAGLYQALNYGEAGLELVIQALRDDQKEVKKTAYSILKQKEETRIIQTLEKYSKYQIFDCISTLEGHESKVNSVCIAPDGQNLISASKNKIRVWECHEKQFRTKRFTISENLGTISDICLNPLDKTILILCTYYLQTYIKEFSWENINFHNSLLLPNETLLHPLITSPNGKTLFMGRRNGKIRVWNWQNRELKYVIRSYSKAISSLAINADGNILFSGGNDNNIKVWDWQLEFNRLIQTLEGHSSSVKALCISPDGKTLFSGSEDYTIKIWNWQKGELIRTLEGHSLGVNSLAISPDGKTLISASNDTTIKVWNWRTGKLQTTLTGHSAEVNSIVLSLDGKYLFSGSSDKTVKVWGLKE